jgi:hypothetical protein
MEPRHGVDDAVADGPAAERDAKRDAQRGLERARNPLQMADS